MSYDLNIWSRQRVETTEREIKIGEYILTIDESVIVENEDIPMTIIVKSDMQFLLPLTLH